jgi:hypothetical protein
LCPEFSCKKDLDFEDIQAARISKSSQKKLEQLLLVAKVNASDNLDFCPITECSKVALLTPYVNLGQCQTCHFKFCISCHGNYHSFELCPTNLDRLVNSSLYVMREEITLEDGTKMTIEKKIYGKENMTVRKMEMESALRKREFQNLSESLFFKFCAKKCPKCKTLIEKAGGCHHMECGNCGLHFCWTCRLPMSKCKAENCQNNLTAVNTVD